MTEGLLNLVSYNTFSPSSWSDHSFVHLDFDLPDSTRRGPGYWKFNSRLLSDDAYCTLIKNILTNWRLKKNMNFQTSPCGGILGKSKSVH